MKRILVCLLCLCLCVTAVACGQSGPFEDLSDLSAESDVSTTTTLADRDDTTTQTDETEAGDTTTICVPGNTTSTVKTGDYVCTGGKTTSSTTTSGRTTTRSRTTYICGLLDPSTSTKPTTTTTTTTEQEQTEKVSAKALGQAQYKRDASRVYDGYTDGMSAYYSRVLPAFLAGNTGENRVCSPISVYLALAMLAESAGGNSRQQVLDLLGTADVSALSRQTAALWNSLYSEKEGAKCLLANSLWLNEIYADGYVSDTVRRLNEDYYASVFSGMMGSLRYDDQLHNWINENTGGLLKEEAMQEKFSKEGIASLVNTVYFNADWEKAFDSKRTDERYFNTSDDRVLCDFMTDSTEREYYWKTEDYIAINRPMNGGFGMWYILPNEDYPVAQLPANGDVLGMITGTGGPERILCDLVTKVPKFDFASRTNLKETLQALGVIDLFTGAADLSTLLGEDSDAFVSGVSHAVRVITKEDGVEAAAYTGITVKKGMSTTTRARPLVYFTADRPFMFAVTGADGTVLFTGIIENPTLKK